MQFKKLNSESMKLGEDAKVSTTYIRVVEKDSRLAQLIKKQSEEEQPGIIPGVPKSSQKDFLATALENCQMFNEEFQGTFDKS